MIGLLFAFIASALVINASQYSIEILNDKTPSYTFYKNDGNNSQYAPT
jgi:hypothetical protein